MYTTKKAKPQRISYITPLYFLVRSHMLTLSYFILLHNPNNVIVLGNQ